MFEYFGTGNIGDDSEDCSGESGINDAYNSCSHYDYSPVPNRPLTSWDGATATGDDWLDTRLWIGALP